MRKFRRGSASERGRGTRRSSPRRFRLLRPPFPIGRYSRSVTRKVSVTMMAAGRMALREEQSFPGLSGSSWRYLTGLTWWNTM